MAEIFVPLLLASSDNVRVTLFALDVVAEDGDGAKSALRVGASEVYSESVGETERRRRDQSARLENSHASHWAALAGNARAITGDAPR